MLINNAGVIEPIARLADAAPTDFARAVAINLNGVFHGMRAVIPLMRAQGGGTIITVSSGAAHNPLEGWGAYCASKAGAAMLTRVAHLEEAAAGPAGHGAVARHGGDRDAGEDQGQRDQPGQPA